jgi:hypothetical protein
MDGPVSWRTGNCEKLHAHFVGQGFKLADYFMSEWARFVGEEPSAFARSFCSQTDERVQRDLQNGFVGALQGQLLEKYEAFRFSRANAQSADRERRNLVAELKRREANGFKIPPDVDFSEQNDFRKSFKTACLDLGFREVKMSSAGLGRAMAIDLASNLSLFLKYEPASFWGASFTGSGAIQTSCGVLTPRNAHPDVAFNLDSVLPGLSLYRTFENWSEAALSGKAIVQAHRCLGECLMA